MNRTNWLGKWLLVLGLVALLGGSVMAQPGGGRPGGGRPGGFGGGFGGGQGDLVNLLNNEQIRREIEVVGDQMRDIESLRESTREKMREAFAGLREASPEERRERMANVQADIRKELGTILLPHQMERLNQISVQMQMRGQGGVARALSAGPLAEELGISDAQREELREKSQAAQEELREKIAELQKDAEEKLMSVLTTEQQEQLKKKMGEPFEMEAPGPGRGGFGAGPGGRGERGEGGRQRGEGGPRGPRGEGGRPGRGQL
ncbi:MAG: hypothetical protein WD045_10615 [Pirellulaceae bacterium]